MYPTPSNNIIVENINVNNYRGIKFYFPIISYISLVNNLFRNFGLYEETKDLFDTNLIGIDNEINTYINNEVKNTGYGLENQKSFTSNSYINFEKKKIMNYLLKDNLKIIVYMFDSSLMKKTNLFDIVENYMMYNVFTYEYTLTDSDSEKIMSYLKNENYSKIKYKEILFEHLFKLEEINNNIENNKEKTYNIFWSYKIDKGLKIFYNNDIIDLNKNNFPNKPPLKDTIFNNDYDNKVNLKIIPLLKNIVYIPYSKYLSNLELEMKIEEKTQLDKYCRDKCFNYTPVQLKNDSTKSLKKQYANIVKNNNKKIKINNIYSLMNGFNSNIIKNKDCEDSSEKNEEIMLIEEL